ncbi:MAG: glycerol dehydrogenase [Synergistaceae bacterium]|nr:glycerol dehydrogenase [Synergistaceae bacterium]
MEKVLIAPGRYVQGSGAVASIGKHAANFGKKALAIGGKRGLNEVRTALEGALKSAGIGLVAESFGGECSKKEIDRLLAAARAAGADFIIGVGGGKAIDTAKAVAFYGKMPVAVLPTIAATDAPCSALAVIYTEDGVFDSYLLLPSNPNLVLVDTAIVARAPVRLLVSGMGDALATWFEAESCSKAHRCNMPGGLTGMTALSLARLCYDTLITWGPQAVLAAEKGVPTEALEHIVEANTLLSGLGFESGGLAAAHAIHNGFTVLPETHGVYHGEKVSFGTLVQLTLEGREPEEIEEVLTFCVKVGLPITLAQLGVENPTEEKLRNVAAAATAEGESIHNEPFAVTAESVYNAIIAADAIGSHFRASVK